MVSQVNKFVVKEYTIPRPHIAAYIAGELRLHATGIRIYTLTFSIVFINYVLYIILLIFILMINNIIIKQCIISLISKRISYTAAVYSTYVHSCMYAHFIF